MILEALFWETLKTASWKGFGKSFPAIDKHNAAIETKSEKEFNSLGGESNCLICAFNLSALSASPSMYFVNFALEQTISFT